MKEIMTDDEIEDNNGGVDMRLKPCPFCGDDTEKGVMEMYRPQTGDKWTRISCRCCGATASLLNWNTRITEKQEAQFQTRLTKE